MNKKTIILIILVTIISTILVLFGAKFGIKWLFSSQYNENGVSHFLVITNVRLVG